MKFASFLSYLDAEESLHDVTLESILAENHLNQIRTTTDFGGKIKPFSASLSSRLSVSSESSPVSDRISRSGNMIQVNLQ